MVDVISDARLLPAAQKRFKDRYKAMIREALAQINGVLTREAGGSDRPVPVARADDVAAAAGAIIQRVFVVDGRRSLTAEGVPLSPYARVLMGEIYLVTAGVVNLHADYIDRHLSDDLRPLLAGRSRQIGEQVERLFEPNPLAEYEAAHTWVDPNGYVLSQRIWQNGIRTRAKMDALLADLIRQGASSQRIARVMEQFLLPDRAKLKTNKPYGVDASYDAMRLARTEIARAHNQAAWVSAYLNPYVDQVRVRRSANGDPTCQVCLAHAGPVGGEGRVYAVTSASLPPWHPYCMCRVEPEVTRSPESVTAELRDFVERGEPDLLPMLTPLQRQTFIDMLLGEALARFVRQLPLGQLELGL